MFARSITSRLAGLVAGGLVVGGGIAAGAVPAYAAPLPSGTYLAHLSSSPAAVTGTATVTHDLSGWTATVQLKGLVPGDTYDYEASIAGDYVDGQAHSFRAVPLCSFTATSSTGSCGVARAQLGTAALTPQSSAFVYSPEAHTSVANGQYGYLARLAAYDQLSSGGAATITPSPSGTWAGQATVSGLTPGDTYTWAVDVADAWSNGQPVGWDRVVLCHFTAATAGSTGCSVKAASIGGLDSMPYGSYSDVASSVTSVASGPLY